MLRAGERHTDRMAWVHFDLWSSPVPGVDGCASGLVWSGLSLLHQILSPPCVSVFTLLSKPACLIICNFTAQEKKKKKAKQLSPATVQL